MTLNEALARVRSHEANGEKKVHFLVCGFQPLHLETFLKAHLLGLFPRHAVELQTGLYGDVLGNLGRAAGSPATAAAVVLEWSDLDPRLGLRASGGWSASAVADITKSVESMCARLESALAKLAARMVVAVAPPSLPLPPFGNAIRRQSSEIVLALQVHLSEFLLRLSRLPGVRIVSATHLAQSSPEHTRLDAQLELMAGFPYTLSHTDALAGGLAAVLHQPAPKKGLITDLDDTLWAGLVGEVGPQAVNWDLENHSQVHGLYQQMLGSLDSQGVLLAACSKNELPVVKEALARADFLFNPDALFPVMASWGVKSKAVEEILRVWNIAADSVVFVDDNPLELDEVRLAHPGITCLQFTPKKPGKVWELLGELRDLFGKPVVLEEDRLRGASIRTSALLQAAAGDQSGSAEFLKRLQGTVTLDFRRDPADIRPLELINKTNQFNLNGQRISEGEWKRLFERPETVVATISYQDKFGPLGKIAVVVGQRQQRRMLVSHWVMSCRAFSRQIEFHTLRALLHEAEEGLELEFQPTDRNQPFREFMRCLGAETPTGFPVISAAEVQPSIEQLPHQESYLKS